MRTLAIIAALACATAPARAAAPGTFCPVTGRTAVRPSLPQAASPVPPGSGTGAAAARAGSWLVQVGAFASRELAQSVATKAAGLIGAPGAATVVTSPSGARFYARVSGLDPASAKAACVRVVADGMPCFPVGPSAT
jgi:hypothetical protein